MSNIVCQKLSEAVTLRSYIDSRFKSMKVSVNMLVPIAEQTAALYGILPGIVTRATEEYPTFASLNKRLSQLYGASLHTSVRKLGDYQCLTLSAVGISNRYAFGGDDMLAELTSLLFSAIFNPLKQDGTFPSEHFEQEKRQLLELKDSEFNDKITYAHQRCEELMFENTSAGVDRYGSREAVNSLSLDELSAAWEKLLSSARFEIFTLGDCHPDPEIFKAHFSGVGAPLAPKPMAFAAPQGVKRVTEEQPLSQSKLSMGFRVNSAPEEKLLFQLTNAVLGGVPSSKLFRNVREEMSLCYYCSSAFSALSRSLYIESGVETENLEKAETEILNQLKAVQNGEITDEELLSAKLALCNSFRLVSDSLNSVENWNLSQIFYDEPMSPEQSAERLMAYTKEQVAEAAQKIQLAVVYSLKGSANG